MTNINLSEKDLCLIQMALALFPDAERKFIYSNHSDYELPEEVKNRKGECQELFNRISAVLPDDDMTYLDE